MLKDGENKRDYREMLEQRNYLKKYFDSISGDEIQYSEEGGVPSMYGDYYDVYFHEEDNILYCKILSMEISESLVADFVVPNNYSDFKQLMNIFLDAA